MISCPVTLFWQRINPFLRWTTLYMSSIRQGSMKSLVWLGWVSNPGPPRHRVNALPTSYRCCCMLQIKLYCNANLLLNLSLHWCVWACEIDNTLSINKTFRSWILCTGQIIKDSNINMYNVWCSMLENCIQQSNLKNYMVSGSTRSTRAKISTITMSRNHVQCIL